MARSRQIGLAVAAVALTTGVACKKESASGPELANELGNIDKALASASPPAEMPVLRWKFDRPTTIAYDYKQRLDVDSDGEKHTAEGAGMFIVVPTAKDSANLSINDFVLKVTIDGESRTLNSPTVKLEGLDELGRVAGGDPSQLHLRLLVPLPGEAFTIGQSKEMPFEFPISGSPSTTSAKGSLKSTLTDFVKCDGSSCAKLETSISVPTVRLEDSTFSLSAKGIVLFDFGRGELAASYLALTLKLDTKLDGEAMSMNQDHFIRMTRARSKDTAVP